MKSFGILVDLADENSLQLVPDILLFGTVFWINYVIP